MYYFKGFFDLWQFGVRNVGFDLWQFGVRNVGSNTSKRKNAGSMKQLGRAKRQKSQAPLGDVETPGSNEVSQG